jgi:hypothetical protein
MRSMRLLAVAVLAFSLIFVLPVVAPRVHAGVGCNPGATICWSSLGSSDWEVASNWADASSGAHRVPAASDDVDLPDVDITVSLTSVQTVHSIHIAGSDVLVVRAAGTLTILSHTPMGVPDNEGDLVVYGKVVNHAAFVDFRKEIDILPGGSFVNYNSLDISESDFLNMGTFVNVCDAHVIEGSADYQKLSGDVTHEPCPATGPVGGLVEPVNKLTVLAPYLALFGVIGAVAVVLWKRPDN